MSRICRLGLHSSPPPPPPSFLSCHVLISTPVDFSSIPDLVLRQLVLLSEFHRWGFQPLFTFSCFSAIGAFYRNFTDGDSNHFSTSPTFGPPRESVGSSMRRDELPLQEGSWQYRWRPLCGYSWLQVVFSCRLYPRNRGICFAGGSTRHLGHSSTILTKKVIRLSRGSNPGYFGLMEFWLNPAGKFSLFPIPFSRLWVAWCSICRSSCSGHGISPPGSPLISRTCQTPHEPASQLQDYKHQPRCPA